MRKVSPVLLLVLGGWQFSASAQDSVTALLQKAIDESARAAGGNLLVVLGNLTYEYSGIGSSFSRYLEERLGAAIVDSPYADLVALDALKNVDPEFAKVFGEVFRVEQARDLVQGRFFDGSRSVRVELDVVNLRDATLIARKSVTIGKELIPSSVSVRPEGQEGAERASQDLQQVLEGGDAGFVVGLTTSRGKGAVYRQGEEVVIYVCANRDAYVKLYSINAEGNATLIFPNEYHRQNFIRRMTVVAIPEASYPFRFVIIPPFGTEFVKAIASTEQFSDIEVSFENLGQVTKRLVTRGIAVVGGEHGQAEALVPYTAVRE